MQKHIPPPSSLVEQDDADSSLPLTLEAEFADFTLTIDNKVSPERNASKQSTTTDSVTEGNLSMFLL